MKGTGMSVRQPTGTVRCATVLLALVMAGGCKATWTPTTLVPPAALQWPFLPGAAKVTYAYALTGITRKTGVATVLESVVYGGAGSRRDFMLPAAVATAADGRIAVADAGCKCVHLYLPRIAKSLRLSGSDRERIASPVGVAFDDEARLYVSDSAGAVFAFDQEGKPRFVLRKAGERPLQRPTGMVWASDRHLLYVVDQWPKYAIAWLPNFVEFTFNREVNLSTFTI